MRRRFCIALDCDGVLKDMHTAYLNILNSIRPPHSKRKAVELKDVTTWEFRDSICTAEEDSHCWEILHRTKGLVRSFPSLPGAYEAVKDLRAFADVICVTSPSLGPYWMTERYEALMEDFGFLKDEIYLASDKSRVVADVLVDDKTDNLLTWPHGFRILMDQPWNQGPQTCAYRAFGWPHAINLCTTHFNNFRRTPFG